MKAKILIVEDDDFLRSLAVSKVTNEGHEVSVAADGEQALEILKTETPELILLDLMLPGVSGFEVLQNVKSNPVMADTKVIVFSNLGADEDIIKARELGADEYMVKSNFTLDELVAKIQDMLV